MSFLASNVGSDDKLPYVLANLVSEYIDIEYLQDFYAIADLDYDRRILLESLQYQTGLEEPNFKAIVKALKQKDPEKRFNELILSNMYHAAKAMIRDGLISDNFDNNTKLFSLSIARYDFDEADRIALGYHDVQESANIFPVEIFNYWIDNGDEEQQEYIANNCHLFLSQYDDFYHTYLMLKPLYNHGFIDIASNLLQGIIDRFSDDVEYDAYIFKYAVLIPGYEDRVVELFNDQFIDIEHEFFKDRIDKYKTSIEGWRDRARQILIAGNVDRNLIDRYL